MKKYIAIIPARGGSKRLPRKNVRLFDGLPLIYYTIKAAKESKNISDVYVSTDDREITELSKKYGANVIVRPDEISGDLATSDSVLVHALEYLDKNSKPSDYLVTLQVTNPLRRDGIVDKAILEFSSHGIDSDSLISVSENKHKLGKIENNCFVPDNYSFGQRSQDLNKLYYENGLVYVTKSEVIRSKRSIFGDKIYPFIINDHYSDVDIDIIEDFEIAETIYIKHKSEFNF